MLHKLHGFANASNNLRQIEINLSYMAATECTSKSNVNFNNNNLQQKSQRKPNMFRLAGAVHFMVLVISLKNTYIYVYTHGIYGPGPTM